MIQIQSNFNKIYFDANHRCIDVKSDLRFLFGNLILVNATIEINDVVETCKKISNILCQKLNLYVCFGEIQRKFNKILATCRIVNYHILPLGGIKVLPASILQYCGLHFIGKDHHIADLP